MKVAVFGASGRTGRLVLDALVNAGHQPVAHSRREIFGWHGESVVSELSDEKAVGDLIAASDAVISCLASNKGEGTCLDLARHVMSRMPSGFRFLTLAGAAVDAPGDRKGLPDKIAGGLARLFAGRMIRERQAELDALLASSLAWTMLRPPVLNDKPATGRVVVTYDKPHAIKISRADVARTMVDMISASDVVGKAPFIAERKA
jgi:putative NADH-flavin reductase